MYLETKGMRRDTEEITRILDGILYAKVQIFPDIVWETAIRLLMEQIGEKRTDRLEKGESA